MGKRIVKIKEDLSNMFELPKDIILDIAKITMIGNNQVTVENHKGIVEYSDELIRVNTGNGILKINGKKLNIKAIMQEEITIAGIIESLSF